MITKLFPLLILFNCLIINNLYNQTITTYKVDNVIFYFSILRCLIGRVFSIANFNFSSYSFNTGLLKHLIIILKSIILNRLYLFCIQITFGHYPFSNKLNLYRYV